MRRKISIGAVLAVLLLALTAGTARAVVAVAGPGSDRTGFATPVVVVPRGAPMFLSSADLLPHNVIAADDFFSKKEAKTRAWCKQFPKGRCPAFWSETIDVGVTEVLGVADLAAGEYPFFCNLHPNMTGSLLIVP